jgi:hypothetical protein
VWIQESFGRQWRRVDHTARGWRQEPIISPVADQNAWGSAGGWYYDNPSAPSRISLCKATCDPILAAPGSRLEVLIGCQTIPRID